MCQKATISVQLTRLSVLICVGAAVTSIALFPPTIFSNLASADCQDKFACEFLPDNCPDCAKTICGYKYRNQQPFRHYVASHPEGMLNWAGYTYDWCAERRRCERDLLEECPEDDAMYVCEVAAEDWEIILTYVNWLGWNPCP